MTTYSFDFLLPVSPDAVARATTDVFGLPADRIEVVVDYVPVRQAIGMPVAYIEYAADAGERVTFSAGDQFAAGVGNLSEVEVASRLCARLRARAMLSVPGASSDMLWRLVTADGSTGLVLIDTSDENEGRYVITGALEPISGAPELPVVGLPEGFELRGL